LKRTTNQIIKKFGKDEIVSFRNLLIQSLIKELRSLPPSRHYGLLKYMKGASSKSLPLREQIIQSIQDANPEDKTGISAADGKFTMTVEIPHELAAALNDGTGIYGPNHQPITPVNKKYMFIPGDDFAKGYYMSKYKKMGLSAADALGRFNWHRSRMVHSRAIRESGRAKQ
jgi:hypothetical protein